jgi:probable selenium-dependent hydroxylase accessory protein YqeC
VTSRGPLTEALQVGSGDLVSLVGGGGKTSLLYRLAAELRAGGLRAAAATTTKIGPPLPEEGSLLCAERYETLRERLRSETGLPVLGSELLASGKVHGIPPDWCGRLLEEGVLDALVVEADGAARKPLKAPEAWEPVVPDATTVFVAVVGLSCLGAPLEEATVFRASRVSEVTGVPLGERVSTPVVAELLRAPAGLLKGRPEPARAVALLNQADGPSELASALEIASLVLLAPSPYERVLAAALRQREPVKGLWTARDLSAR